MVGQIANFKTQMQELDSELEGFKQAKPSVNEAQSNEKEKQITPVKE